MAIRRPEELYARGSVFGLAPIPVETVRIELTFKDAPKAWAWAIAWAIVEARTGTSLASDRVVEPLLLSAAGEVTVPARIPDLESWAVTSFVQERS